MIRYIYISCIIWFLLVSVFFVFEFQDDICLCLDVIYPAAHNALTSVCDKHGATVHL